MRDLMEIDESKSVLERWWSNRESVHLCLGHQINGCVNLLFDFVVFVGVACSL